jgi:hypothetical protein
VKIAIGDATILLDAVDTDRDGRTVYGYSIRIDGVTPFYQARDLKSGCQGGTETEGLASLLSFLSAAVESRRYRESTGREGDNESLFPAEVVDWAYQHDMEIQCAAIELEGGGQC